MRFFDNILKIVTTTLIKCLTYLKSNKSFTNRGWFLCSFVFIASIFLMTVIKLLNYSVIQAKAGTIIQLFYLSYFWLKEKPFKKITVWQLAKTNMSVYASATGSGGGEVSSTDTGNLLCATG